MLVTDQAYRERRLAFFKIIYGTALTEKAYACIAARARGSKSFEEEFFQWPNEASKLLDHIDSLALTHDLWYSVQLFSKRERKKQFSLPCTTAWADLDPCDPQKLVVPASIVIESSPGRYQALWLLAEELPPFDAENISKRIAYFHKDDGIDHCWNLTRILRVPYTHNFKYDNALDAPVVNILKANTDPIEISAFDVYPKVKDEIDADQPFPEAIPNVDDVLFQYRHDLHPMVYVLYSTEPKDDWSSKLWQLENLCLESGLSLEEAFAVCRAAKCNKYERDSRSEHNLWREVCRASALQNEEVAAVVYTEVESLLSPAERRAVEDKMRTKPSFIENYITWASGLGDAAPQYHQAGAFIVLASILAGSVRLPTSFGTLTPNLWFMILADTTLTRKTTSMDIAMDLVTKVNESAILATDGSVEGLFTGLSTRPGVPSIFLRDEFSGLLESMTKKDYYAGMAEQLTKLYDGKMQKRILKRETIEVRDPVLIIFAGGIKNRIYELLTYEQVSSGFLPRFIFITAEADLTKIRPVGPPTTHQGTKRAELIYFLKDLNDYYNKVDTSSGSIIKKMHWAELTPDAWARYNQIEAFMLAAGMDSARRDLLTPTFDRLAKSGLKAAVLLAASDKKSETPLVTVEHLTHAFWYVEKWMGWTIEVLANIGKGTYERTIDNIVAAVEREPGIMRGTIMKMFQLNSRQADDYLMTLEQRGHIRIYKSGKSARLEPNTGGSANGKSSGTGQSRTIQLGRGNSEGKYVENTR